MINELRRSSGINPSELILPTSLGPITIQALNYLEGWRYDLFNLGFPGTEPTIINGGPPVILADYTDERGWILFFAALFRSPYGTLNFIADNYVFSANPWILNITGLNVVNAFAIYVNIYNPVTPLGPLYGVSYGPTISIPYASRLQVTLNLPAGVPVAATTIQRAAIGKIFIVDQTLFLKSIKRHIAEQMSGRRIDRYI
jgi:hypothetical protein